MLAGQYLTWKLLREKTFVAWHSKISIFTRIYYRIFFPLHLVCTTVALSLQLHLGDSAGTAQAQVVLLGLVPRLALCGSAGEPLAVYQDNPKGWNEVSFLDVRLPF